MIWVDHFWLMEVIDCATAFRLMTMENGNTNLQWMLWQKIYMPKNMITYWTISRANHFNISIPFFCFRKIYRRHSGYTYVNSWQGKRDGKTKYRVSGAMYLFRARASPERFFSSSIAVQCYPIYMRITLYPLNQGLDSYSRYSNELLRNQKYWTKY